MSKKSIGQLHKSRIKKSRITGKAQLGAIARNQDKGLSRDIQVILDEFSFELVARKQVELNPAK